MDEQLRMVSTWLTDLGLGHLTQSFFQAGFESLLLISQITLDVLQINGFGEDPGVTSKLISAIGRLKQDLAAWNFVDDGRSVECKTCQQVVQRVHANKHRCGVVPLEPRVQLEPERKYDQEHEQAQSVTMDVEAYIRGLDLLYDEDVAKVVAKLHEVGADSLQRLKLLQPQDLTNAGFPPACIPSVIAKFYALGYKCTPFAKGMRVGDWLQMHDLGVYERVFIKQGHKTRFTILIIGGNELTAMSIEKPIHLKHLHQMIHAT